MSASTKEETTEISDAPQTVGLFEMVLEVADLAASERFYHEHLGLPIVERWEGERPGLWLDMGRENALGLWPVETGGAKAIHGGRGGSHVHFAIRVPNGTLDVIKKGGEVDVETIATQLAMTPSGARQHLTALERDGLVSHRQERTGPGRPRHRFALTAAGDALFPRNYVDLTNELLEYVEDADPALLEAIFAKRGQRRLERALLRTSGLAFPDQVAEIARILDEDGYLADFEARPDGSYLIREHNCAVLGVALRYRHACSSELEFLQDALPTAEVTRVAHRIASGHICAYEVRPKDGADGTRPTVGA